MLQFHFLLFSIQNFSEFSTVSEGVPPAATNSDLPPCPLCNKQFSTIEELTQHAAICC